MEGSIFEMFRGFSARKRIKTELLLNKKELRVELREIEGLLCKIARVDR